MKKTLTLSGAVFIGLASMLGAGVFGVFGPAAELAGNLLWLSIAIAGLVAYLNASSVAQLARVVTRSGGAYSYGRHYLSNSAGFVAGAAFLIGKTGSVAAIALTFSYYVTPGFEKLTAVIGVLLMTTVNILGVNRTALGAKILASTTISFLLLLVIGASLETASPEPLASGSILGVMGAASLFFFAFAGYARVATLGGEVEYPSKNIPRAIAISLAVVLLLYMLLGAVAAEKLGAGLSQTLTPLKDLAATALPWLPAAFVPVFASVAALGSLLALLAGMGRTAATMAEDGELPRIFAKQNSKGVPYFAEFSLGLFGIILVVSGGVISSIGISSFAVLTYYAVANWAAFRQPKADSTRPKWLNLLGLALCIALALSVPTQGLLVGFVALFSAFVLRFFFVRSSI